MDDSRAITPTLPSYDALMRAGIECGQAAREADRAYLIEPWSAESAAMLRRAAMKSFTAAAAHLGYRLVPVAETAATTGEQNP